MPITCKVNPDKSLTFSGTSRKRYWCKNPDDYGNPSTEYIYDEQRFIEDMGFRWLGYDGVEGRGLWGGPVWTDSTLYWTYGNYAIRSFLEDLQFNQVVYCDLSVGDDYIPGVRYLFTDSGEARLWLREHINGWQYWMAMGDDALDLAQKLSDYDFEQENR